MDILAVLERFGVPVAVAVAFGYFIWKQNQYLTKDIHSKFNRLEGIIVQLINQQKKMQIELRGIKSQYDALVTIITDLLKGKSNGKN